MALNYRPYASSDLEACITFFRSNIPRFFREHEFQAFTESIGSFEYPYFVVSLDDEPVGCGGYSIQNESDTANLCWGMVHQDYHGQRIGEYLLLLRLREIARTPGTRFVRLGTCQHTEGFFQRYGFESQSKVVNGVAHGLDEVEMKLALTDRQRAFIESRFLKETRANLNGK